MKAKLYMTGNFAASMDGSYYSFWNYSDKVVSRYRDPQLQASENYL